jgi:hypothetical protein
MSDNTSVFLEASLGKEGAVGSNPTHAPQFQVRFELISTTKLELRRCE